MKDHLRLAERLSTIVTLLTKINIDNNHQVLIQHMFNTEYKLTLRINISMLYPGCNTVAGRL